jgi:Arc/MetJ-type ribon-helix-helix transcriptional regulator
LSLLTGAVPGRTINVISRPSDGSGMPGPNGPLRVTVTLPPWVVERLEAEVAQHRYPSIEEAVLAGARLVAGLGPRATELLREGRGADGLVRGSDGREGGEWL